MCFSSSSGSCTHTHKAPVLQPEQRLPPRRSQISGWIKTWQTVFHLSRTLPGSLCQTRYSNCLQWGLSLRGWNWGDLQGKHKVSRTHNSTGRFGCKAPLESHWKLFCVFIVTRTRVANTERSMRQRSSFKFESWMLPWSLFRSTAGQWKLLHLGLKWVPAEFTVTHTTMEISF